jgi:inosine/xanthosine triphosphate pyrophosphatase family protein
MLSFGFDHIFQPLENVRIFAAVSFEEKTGFSFYIGAQKYFEWQRSCGSMDA